MQTGAIRYRVSDFLKQHPPFHAMEETDLLGLVEHGRVKFHEGDEFIYWQGGAHGQFFYVIQQGTVALWEGADAGERLRDIRGTGDLLGIDRFLGAEAALYSAKTCSDVVIYALSATDFGPLVVKYPEAGRYLASHAVVTADYQQPGRRRPANQTFLADVVELRPPLTCGPEQPIQEAARLMAASGVQSLTVGRRVVTRGEILRAIGDCASPAMAVGTLAHEPSMIPPDSTVSDCVLAMARSKDDVLAIGKGGSIHSVVTAADLAPAFQDEPIAILRGIAYAADAAALRRLNQRARAFIREQLGTASSVDWLTRFAHYIDASILRRILAVTRKHNPEACWCFYSAAGREESLGPVTPGLAVIGEEDPEPVTAALTECGYVLPGESHHASLNDWKDLFRNWIEDPIRSRMYLARPLFDLRPVLGADQAWRDLNAHVTRIVQANRTFVRLLAHDCLANLPPLTFYRNRVIEESGEETRIFHLDRSALQPLVDVGRVFGLAAGRGLGGSTLERFAHARAFMPEQASIFREAAEALRIVLYHQARAAIRHGTAGSDLSPASLSRYDRQILKNCFRSILHLLEFTAECRWLETE